MSGHRSSPYRAGAPWSWLGLGAAAAVIFAGACASSSGSSSTGAPAQTRNVLRVGSYAPVEMWNEPGRGARTLPAPADVVWGALPAVYEALGIPVTDVDPQGQRIGNLGYRSTRVDGDRMNTFIDCGTTLAGPLANQYDVQLSIVTDLTAQGSDSTVVTTTVDASGRPRGVSGNPLHCQSRGVLELRVAQRVAEALGIGS